MDNKIRKFVITGGPCTGKTSVILELEKKGFQIVSEVAREIIEREQALGGNNFPWIDLDRFNQELVKMQLEKEKAISAEIAFLDRGILDNLAYYTWNNNIPIPELIEAAKTSDYSAVFLLDRLNLYEKDSVRKEDIDKARKLHEEISKVYEEAGFKVIRIPPVSVKERVKMILSQLKI